MEEIRKWKKMIVLLSDFSFELVYEDAVRDIGADFADKLRQIRVKNRNKALLSA